MVATALKFITKALDDFFVERSGYPLDSIKLSNLVNRDGTPVANNANVLVSLVQLEEDRTEAKSRVYQKTPDGKVNIFPPPIKMNAYVLFSSPRIDYSSALQDISTVMLFFQKHPLFTPEEFPNLNDDAKPNKPWRRIAELAFQLHTLTFEQHSYVWSVLGSKYVPSVLYKMRFVTVFDTNTNIQGSPIEQIDYPISNKQ
jgi:hypothetical protein